MYIVYVYFFNLFLCIYRKCVKVKRNYCIVNKCWIEIMLNFFIEGLIIWSLILVCIGVIVCNFMVVNVVKFWRIVFMKKLCIVNLISIK